MPDRESRTRIIDVEYLGKTRLIASCLLESAESLAIVDLGPSSTFTVLRSKLRQQGLLVDDLNAILLTHIHLDHAGATGTLVRENPQLKVFVHEKGVPHLADPARLIESASRLYGNEMGRLWGEILPVPAENLRPPGTVLRGGSSIPGTYIMTGPKTGARSIDLEGWNTSLDKIVNWRPARLCLTHFGFPDEVEKHLEELREGLQAWSQWVRDSLRSAEEDASRAYSFADSIEAELKRFLPSDEVARYRWGAALEPSWYGLARYWRKQ